jgi:hypothetical protein
LDLFDNPVGYLPAKGWFQVSQKNTDFGQNPCFLLFLSGGCSETEVSEQLYSMFRKQARTTAKRRPQAF